MDDSAGDRTVTLELTRSEALVFDQWLASMDDPDNANELSPFEQAALRVRWDLECLLEKELPEHFATNFDEKLEAAIDDVRDEWYADD